MTGVQTCALPIYIKAEGLPHKIMVEALEKAKKARLDILETMLATISRPIEKMSEYAPKMVTTKIDPELIGKIIGPGGKVIKSIQEDTATKIEIEENGTIFISSMSGDGYLKAKDIIESMTQPPKVGHIYRNSKVVSVKDFGVFVEIIPGIEGLCHISEISNEYVKNIEDVCKVGDEIDVKLLSIDDQGRFKLSRKAAMTGTEKQGEAEEATVASAGD